MGVVRLLREPSSPTFERERTPGDAVLVCAARAGEPWAQEALFRRHVPRVAGLAHRLLASTRADVDELVRDGFVQALQRLGDPRATEGFATWLEGILVRTAVLRLRRRRLRRSVGLWRSAPPDLDGLIAASAPPEVRVILRRTYEHIERLPAEERATLVLRRLEGLTIEELAGRLGVSLSTAQRRLRRAERQVPSLQGLRANVVHGETEPKAYFEPELSDARVAQLWAGVARGVPAPTVRERSRRHRRSRRDRRLGPSLAGGVAAVVIAAGVAAVAVAAGMSLRQNEPPPASSSEADPPRSMASGGLSMTWGHGSSLQFAPRSRFEIDESAEEHVALDLVRGQVVCDVSPDVERGLVVWAGSFEVRGLGTRFSVERAFQGELFRSEVRVERGFVEVTLRDGAVAPRRLGSGESWAVVERPSPRGGELFKEMLAKEMLAEERVPSAARPSSE